MVSSKFQFQDASDRKETVLIVKRALQSLDRSKYPNITNTLNSGNTKVYALLNLILDQMYVLNFDVNSSLLAVEENI